jgi:GT2 family glycosyltransferase
MPFKAPTDAADAEDVTKIYNLLHRRDPESKKVTDQFCGQTIASLYSIVLKSPEFNTKVLQPLTSDQVIWGPYRGSTSFAALLRWATTALPVGPDFWAKLAPHGSWEDFYLALLLDVRAQEFNSGLGEPSIRSALQVRLRNARLNQNRVVGAVEYANLWEVGGWCGDEAGGGENLTVEVFADNVFIGTAECDRCRPDIQALLGGSGIYGFAVKFSPSHLAIFQADRWISVREKSTKRTIGRVLLPSSNVTERVSQLGRLRRELEQIKAVLDRIETDIPEHNSRSALPLFAYSEYFDVYSRDMTERLTVYRDRLEGLPNRLVVSVVLSVDAPSLEALDGSIQSVRQQVYPDWELLIVVRGAAALADAVACFLSRQARIDPRIKPIVEGADGAGRGLARCSGEIIGFLKCGDRLAPDALFHAVSAAQDGWAGLIYTDEDEFENLPNGSCVHHAPQFKSAFDLDLLLSCDYLGNFLLASVECLAKIVPADTLHFDEARHDLALRLVERLEPGQIRHVPRVLYHRNASREKVDAGDAEGRRVGEDPVQSVNAYFDRNRIAAIGEPHADPLGGAQHGACRIRWALPTPPPTVSIIIPTRDRKELLAPCFESLNSCSEDYPGEVELIVVDNDTTEPEAKALLTYIGVTSRSRVVNFRGPFNWSALNNFAAEQAKGDVLIFLNNDTLVLSEGWCIELVSQASRQDVGAVGARLLYEDGTIQHAGVVVGIGRGLADHEGVGEMVADGGYLGRSRLQRGVSAVTGACLATRKVVFERLQGFDEVHFPVSFNDIDYCLKVREANLKVIYTPFATMYHYESKSRGIATTDKAKRRQCREEMHFQLRYKGRIDDPFYNTHFSRYSRPFTMLRPPAENGP